MKKANVEKNNFVSQPCSFKLYVFLYFFFSFPFLSLGQNFITNNTQVFITEASIIIDSSSIQLQPKNSPEKIYIGEGTLIIGLQTNSDVSLIKIPRKKKLSSFLPQVKVNSQTSSNERKSIQEHKEKYSQCSYSKDSSESFSPHSTGKLSAITSTTKNNDKQFTILTEKTILSLYYAVKKLSLGHLYVPLLFSFLSADRIRPPPSNDIVRI